MLQVRLENAGNNRRGLISRIGTKHEETTGQSKRLVVFFCFNVSCTIIFCGASRNLSKVGKGVRLVDNCLR